MNQKINLSQRIKRCPKTGRIIGCRWPVWLFPLAGCLALLWILIRLIPKPSRATYPCMRIAMPMASGFLLWIGSLIVSGIAFLKASLFWRNGFYLFALILTALALGTLHITTGLQQPVKAAYPQAYHPANQPIGTGRGIFPGRVVWVHDPDATNEDCDPGAYGHGWFLTENNDQPVIDQMLSRGLQKLTGISGDSAAWQAIFHYHNQQRGKGAVGYQNGEKIFLKINVTSSWGANIDLSDFSKIENQYYGVSETAPQLVLALLRQLVYVAGVPQELIYVGDPMKHIYRHCYELWHTEFPDVHYLDNSETHHGREKVVPSSTAIVKYSDRGAVLRTGTWEDATAGDPVTQDYLYTIFTEAEYILNIPTLKGHKHAGITAFAKNHFGSHTRSDAKHLHGGLVAIDFQNPQRNAYGLYRVQVDLMGHYLLGEKNLLYVMDGLWSSDYEIDAPDKWQLAPFEGDWMSSIFLSQDGVAIESVGFDFLRAEFTAERGLATYPQMGGVDDYLRQAADSTCWPPDIQYDPEADGEVLTSLGVHEHWNNPTDKQYSRNLGLDQGIELLKVSAITGADNLAQTRRPHQLQLYQNHPNPFNPVTRIQYTIKVPQKVTLTIFDPLGRKIQVLVDAEQAAGTYNVHFDGSGLASGIYYYRLTAGGSQTKKMMLLK